MRLIDVLKKVRSFIERHPYIAAGLTFAVLACVAGLILSAPFWAIIPVSLGGGILVGAMVGFLWMINKPEGINVFTPSISIQFGPVLQNENSNTKSKDIREVIDSEKKVTNTSTSRNNIELNYLSYTDSQQNQVNPNFTNNGFGK